MICGWWKKRHKWNLVIGRVLFLRCGKCLEEYHGNEWEIRAAFVSCKVPTKTRCTS